MTTRSILLTILNIISTIVGLTLGARVILRLLGVSSTAPIVQWLMGASEALLFPFRGLLQDIFLSTTSVIDTTAVLALIVYAIFFSLLYRLFLGISGTVVETDSGVHTHSV